MFRFIALAILATISSLSFAASGSGEDARRIAAEYIRTVATDYSIVSKGYAAALKEPEIQAGLRSKLSPDMLAKAGDRISNVLEAFGGSIGCDAARWDKIATAAAAWISNLSTSAAAAAPADLLNALLHFRLVQEEDYAILQYRKGTEESSTIFCALIPFNEALQKGQLDDLKDMWDKVFKYADPLYQDHYSESNPRYIGKGQTKDTFHKVGASGTVRETSDPTVKQGIKVTLASKSAKGAKSGKPVAAHITSQIGVTLNVTTKMLGAEALPTVIVEPYECGPMWFMGQLVTNDLLNIIFTFPDSGFRVELQKLVPDVANGMVEQFDEVIKDMLSTKPLRAKQKEKLAVAAPAAVDPETEYMNTLSPAQLEDYLMTGKRPDAASATAPSTAKPGKGKKGKAVEVAVAAAAGATGGAAAAAAGAGAAGSGSASSRDHEAVAATAGAGATGGGASSREADRVLHNARTLELAARMARERDAPLPDRAYAVHALGLKPDDKAMLANLLKINQGGIFGAIQAVNVYKWVDLEALMKALGFTVRENHTFTYDATRRIGLDYIHSTGHHLYPRLMDIWETQMASIGFTKEHLVELLGK